jgi:lysozyme family protein
VNVGTARSSRWFQTALNSLNRGGKDYPPIYVDGRVGASTIAAYKGLQKVRGKVPACELILKLLDAQQAMHYLNLPHLNVYTPGWVAHRIGNVPLSRCAE